MKRIATIILNRNLPNVTDRLCDRISKTEGELTDIYVVEAGSDDDKLSKNTTWHADWVEARSNGLRYSRGMNYGLSQLWLEKKFDNYDAFFLLTNDVEFCQENTLEILIEELDKHPQLGILSPCSPRWGEKMLLDQMKTKYFWFIHNNAYLLRKDFIYSVANFDEINYMKFLFDGDNFRGYGAESELIAKGYANDWAAAITTMAFARENESYLINQSDLIKTEKYEENLQLYIKEGYSWMRKKYGFNSRWTMQQYVKNMYDSFFDFHPELLKYQI